MIIGVRHSSHPWGNYAFTGCEPFLDFGRPLAARVAVLTCCSSFKMSSGWVFSLIVQESRLAASVVDATAFTGVGLGGGVDEEEWQTVGGGNGFLANAHSCVLFQNLVCHFPE